MGPAELRLTDVARGSTLCSYFLVSFAQSEYRPDHARSLPVSRMERRYLRGAPARDQAVVEMRRDRTGRGIGVQIAALCACLFAMAVPGAVAGDSVGYRGINTSGHFEGKGLLKKWRSHQEPKLLWKTFVGTGFAGPLVKDGRVYVIGGNPARLYVLTLDGELLKTISMGPSGWKRFSGSRSTPLKYGDVVVGQMPNANIYAVDLETQETKWLLNAWTGIGSGKGGMGWGVPESPMQHKNLYIVNPCSRDEETPGIAALDSQTGEIVWGVPGKKKTEEEPNNRWSATDVAGSIFTHNGRAIVAYPTWTYLACVDAETGTLLWDIRKADGVSALAPIYNDGYLLWDPPGWLQMLKLSKDGSDYEVLWTAAGSPPGYTQGVILDGRAYIFGRSTFTTESGPCSKEENAKRVVTRPPRTSGGPSQFGLLCLDAETGEKIHFQPITTDRAGHWWTADGMVYAWWLGGKGSKADPVVALIQPTEDGFELVSMFKVELDVDSKGVAEVDWQINTCPTICEGRLFLRYGSLYVYDLRIEQPAYGWRVDGSGLTENTSPPIRWSREENLLWSCELPGRALSAPVVQKEAVCVLTDNGLACVRNGVVAWTGKMAPPGAGGDMAQPTPVMRDGNVYAAANDGALACFGPKGEQLWKVDIPPGRTDRPASSPVLCEELTIVQGRQLQARRVKDGSEAWAVPVPARSAGRTPVRCRLDDGVVLFTSWGAVVRASDGKVLVEDLPEMATGSPVATAGAVYFCGSRKPGARSTASAYRLPAKAGERLELEKLWERKLDFVCNGTPLVDEGLIYMVDAGQSLHVLDASDGSAVREEPLLPEEETRATGRREGDLVRAGGAVYAVNLGSRQRTVIVEPGRKLGKVWEYAVKGPSPGNPAFEMERQYICVSNVMYGIGGETPSAPTPPRSVAVPADTSLGDVTGLPVTEYVPDKAPEEWVTLGPFKPRSLVMDFLAGIGGASNAVLKAGLEIKYKTKTYLPKAIGPDGWFRPNDKKFTAGVDSIDVSRAIDRQWHRTEYFYTVLEFDSPRCIEFRLLSPGGNIWNPKSRLDARVWLAGHPIENGSVLSVQKGRYPLMLQVGVGTCEAWGAIWMAPRFADVTGVIADRQVEYQKNIDKLFVLGE